MALLPPELTRALRQLVLDQIRSEKVLGSDEFSLFNWYVEMTYEASKQMELAELSNADPENTGPIAVEYFSRRQRSSQVIHLASLFETMLRREGERLSGVVGQGSLLFRANELKGDLWTANRRFLERHGHFALDDSLWRPVNDLLTVRRVLVHLNGSTETLSEDERNSLKKIEGIAINERGELVVDIEFVRRASHQVSQLVDHVASQVNEVIDRAKHPKVV